jgi:hypothetical protein
MEYRAWQLRFLQWLDTQPSGVLINLCGGPWGKTTLAKMNQDANVSYYHSFKQLSQIQDDLQNGKKVVFTSILRLSIMNHLDKDEQDSQENFQKLKNLPMETYEIEAQEDTNNYLKFANEYEL